VDEIRFYSKLVLEGFDHTTLGLRNPQPVLKIA
jgi:hypothetical protein